VKDYLNSYQPTPRLSQVTSAESPPSPGANGALTGVFHTDIVSGACKGSIEMPLTATPYSPPVI
jgi:hypothetical protein